MAASRSLTRYLFPLVVALVSPPIYTSAFSARLETSLIDTWFSLRSARPVPRDVTLVRIDPRSLRRLGLPIGTGLGYERLAQIVEKIGAAGAKLIVLDIYFGTVSADADGDNRFAAALAAWPTVIARAIVPWIDTDLEGRQHVELERTIPAELVTHSAAAVVPMMIRKDPDGIVRKVNLMTDASPLPIERTPLLGPLREHVSSKLSQPEDYDLINYYGPPYAIPDVPVYKLLLPGESVPPEYFRDRVVFIGGVDTRNGNPDGGDDSFMTPMSYAPMYGVEIHATVTQNLIDGSWIRRGRPELEIGAQSACLVVVAILLVNVGTVLTTGVTLVFAPLWVATSYASFTCLGIFVPGVTLFAFTAPLLLVGTIVLEQCGIIRKGTS